MERAEVIQRLTFLEKGELVNLADCESQQPEAENVGNENCYGFMYFEVSAKTGQNIENCVLAIAEQILKTKKTKRHKSDREKDFGTTRIYAGPNLLDIPQQKKSCCNI